MSQINKNGLSTEYSSGSSTSLILVEQEIIEYYLIQRRIQANV